MYVWVFFASNVIPRVWFRVGRSRTHEDRARPKGRSSLVGTREKKSAETDTCNPTPTLSIGREGCFMSEMFGVKAGFVHGMMDAPSETGAI